MAEKSHTVVGLLGEFHNGGFVGSLELVLINSLLIYLPINGLLFLAARHERKKNQAILDEQLRVLGVYRFKRKHK